MYHSITLPFIADVLRFGFWLGNAFPLLGVLSIPWLLALVAGGMFMGVGFLTSQQRHVFVGLALFLLTALL